MKNPLGVDVLSPLIELAARPEVDPVQRARALEIALRFPRTPEVTESLGRLYPGILRALDDPDARESLIDVGPLVPVPGVVEALDEACRTDHERLRDAATRALAKADAGGAVPRLVDLTLTTGSLEAAEALAGLDTRLLAVRLPMDPLMSADAGDPFVDFYIAVAIAKAGSPERLLAYIRRETDEPPFLWGDPTYAYDVLSALRPLPDDVILQILDAAGIEDPTDPDQVAGGGLLVWGLTGIADAAGVPPGGPESARGGVRPPLERSVDDDWDTPLLDLIEAAPTDDPMEGIQRANSVMEVALDRPMTDDPVLATQILRTVVDGITPLDTGQLAWIAYRFGDLAALIREAAAGWRTPRQHAFLAAVAEEASGRTGSIFRGAGGGGAEPTPEEASRVVSLRRSMRTAAMPEPAAEADAGGDMDLDPAPAGMDRAQAAPQGGDREAAVVEEEEEEEEEVAEGVADDDALAVLRRTPHMDLSGPGPFSIGDRIRVTVYADTEEARSFEAASDIEIRAPISVRTFEVTATLLASGSHLRVLGEPRRSVILDRAAARSREVHWDVEVIEPEDDADAIAVTPGSFASLMVLFTYGGRPSGHVSRSVVLDLADRDTPVDPPEEPPEAEAVLRVDTEAQPCDLTVTVTRLPHDAESVYRYMVSSPHVELDLPANPAWRISGWDEVSGMLEDFVEADPVDRPLELRAAGKNFFDVSPEGFQRYFWWLFDNVPDFQSIQIVSADRVLPWELILPYRNAPLKTDRDPKLPIGAGFDVGRWTPLDDTSPAQNIRITDGMVVAPVYASGNLPMAAEEARLVSESFGLPRVHPANRGSLTQALESHDGGLFHFVGHGDYLAESRNQVLELDSEALKETILNHLLDESGFLAKGPTFVFLNCCQVGRPAPSSLRPGGVAQVFVRRGAGMVLAPIWDVADGAAHEVAKTIYAAIRESPEVPLARTLRTLRRRSFIDGPEGADDSFMAYCLYGDPLGTVG